MNDDFDLEKSFRDLNIEQNHVYVYEEFMFTNHENAICEIEDGESVDEDDSEEEESGDEEESDNDSEDDDENVIKQLNELDMDEMN